MAIIPGSALLSPCLGQMKSVNSLVMLNRRAKRGVLSRQSRDQPLQTYSTSFCLDSVGISIFQLFARHPELVSGSHWDDRLPVMLSHSSSLRTCLPRSKRGFGISKPNSTLVEFFCRHSGFTCSETSGDSESSKPIVLSTLGRSCPDCVGTEW